jgi:signal transduction histidine kinase
MEQYESFCDRTGRIFPSFQPQMPREELDCMTPRFLSAREEESARIARDIHDEIGSMLTLLRWDLEALHLSVSRLPGHGQSQQLPEKIDTMMALTDTALSSVKRIASELRPPALDLMGLRDAIEWQAKQFQERTGIIVTCDCARDVDDFSAEQATSVFRIVQEALTNIVRHAQGTKVNVRLQRQNDELILTIKDNGRGITKEETWNNLTLGLTGMRERAALAGGQVEISGTEGDGTLVRLQIPIIGSRDAARPGVSREDVQ